MTDQERVLAVYPDAYAVASKPVNGIVRTIILAGFEPKAKVLCDTTRAEHFAWQTAARMLGTEVVK